MGVLKLVSLTQLDDMNAALAALTAPLPPAVQIGAYKSGDHHYIDDLRTATEYEEVWPTLATLEYVDPAPEPELPEDPSDPDGLRSEDPPEDE